MLARLAPPRRRRILSALALAAAVGVLGACATAAPEPPRGVPADAPEVTQRQVMVTLRPAPPSLWDQTTRELSLNYRLRTVFAWSMDSLGERCIVFDVTSNRSAAQVVRELTGDPRVGTVQLIQSFETLAGADHATPAAGSGAGYGRLQRGAQLLRLAAAHRMATGRGIKVAVIDTGVDIGHPDLKNRIARANNFVDRGEQTFASDIHGTAVAGVIAADGENEGRIVSAAPDAEIYALKACWPQPPGSRQAVCNSYTLARAIDFAINEHAQILNFSLAGPSDPLLNRLVHTALARGITVIAAEAPTPAAGTFPASIDGVIGVLASDLEGGLRTPAPAGSHLAAPGVDILTTVPHGSYDFFSGSSLAAAEVSGVAALLLEKSPHLTPAQVREALVKSAKPIRLQPGDPDPDVMLVDACGALAQVGAGSC
jgi:subtilisin family serine protease